VKPYPKRRICIDEAVLDQAIYEGGLEGHPAADDASGRAYRRQGHSDYGRICGAEKGYRRLNGCESTEYILGMIQFRDLQGNDYIFFGDRYDLYKLSFGIMRYWDDGYA